MRNLYLASLDQLSFHASTTPSPSKEHRRITQSTPDPDFADVFYVATEGRASETTGSLSIAKSDDKREDRKIELYRIAPSQPARLIAVLPVQQGSDEQQDEASAPPLNQTSKDDEETKSLILSLHILPETRHLMLILRNGEIWSVAIPDEDVFSHADDATATPTIEDFSSSIDVVQGTEENVGAEEKGVAQKSLTLEGIFSPSITSAAWSPDSGLLALTTGAATTKELSGASSDKMKEDRQGDEEAKDGLLVLLSVSSFGNEFGNDYVPDIPDFSDISNDLGFVAPESGLSLDIVLEQPLNPSEFGGDRPVDVGWGSLETQFLGKGVKGDERRKANEVSSIGEVTAEGRSHQAGSTETSQRGEKEETGNRKRETVEDPTISWRGDGAFFVVSSSAPSSSSRLLRTYTRTGALQSTSEIVNGLLGVCAWRPSGALIASVRRDERASGSGKSGAGKLEVVFFEKNGLRHGGFEIKGVGAEGGKVYDIAWSPCSNVLLVWVGGVVQLYTTGNYHWYLKHEILVDNGLTGLSWHPDKELCLVLRAGDSLHLRTYDYETVTSVDEGSLKASTPVSPSTGTVLVLDGPHILVTPMAKGVVPPPMWGIKVDSRVSSTKEETSKEKTSKEKTEEITESTPIQSSLCPLTDIFGVLWEGGRVGVWALDLHERESNARGFSKLGTPKLLALFSTPTDIKYRQILIPHPDMVVLLGRRYGGKGEEDVVVFVRLSNSSGLDDDLTAKSSDIVALPSLNGRLVPVSRGWSLASGNKEKILWMDKRGMVFLVSPTSIHPIGTFPSHTPTCLATSNLVVGMGASGLLSMLRIPSEAHSELNSLSDDESEAIDEAFDDSSFNKAESNEGKKATTLATNATSFIMASSYLIWTSRAHVATFVALESLSSISSATLAATNKQGGETTLEAQETKSRETKAIDGKTEQGWPTRRIERGARIVTALPGDTVGPSSASTGEGSANTKVRSTGTLQNGLVMQMPRGNLETVFPRVLVEEGIKGFLASHRWRAAFLSARRGRVDLGILVREAGLASSSASAADASAVSTNAEAHGKEEREELHPFVPHIPSFIAQIPEPDYLCAFLVEIGRSTFPKSVISAIADGVRAVLTTRSSVSASDAEVVESSETTSKESEKIGKAGLDPKYITTVLTTHVMKTPPDLERALGVLGSVRDTPALAPALAYLTMITDSVLSEANSSSSSNVDSASASTSIKSNSTFNNKLSTKIKFKQRGTFGASATDTSVNPASLTPSSILFDTALGMYDFGLVLIVAGGSGGAGGKDPREYLPFLRHLRSLPHFEQRFAIDDYLGRVGKAVRWLKGGGPALFLQALAYIDKHGLYEEALEMWDPDNQDEEGGDTGEYDKILTLYGEYLFERREFGRAAQVFLTAHAPYKALVAYERNQEWRELFELAVLLNGEQREIDIPAMAYRVSEALEGMGRCEEGARVLLDYGRASASTGDVEEREQEDEDDGENQDSDAHIHAAIAILCRGGLFGEARRVVAIFESSSSLASSSSLSSNRSDELGLLQTAIFPAALDASSSLIDDIGEIRATLRKQRQRVKELVERREEVGDAFYATDFDDGMTDATTVFTRYTTKSKQTSRSRRKSERKLSSGKRGTVDEHEYLLKSIGKGVEKVRTVGATLYSLIPTLALYDAETNRLNRRNKTTSLEKKKKKRSQEATDLKNIVQDLVDEVNEIVTEVWGDHPGSTASASTSTSGPAGTGAPSAGTPASSLERPNPLDKVPRPEEVQLGEVWYGV
ncbi:IKI3 family-domain-containing protein [Mycena floridula]|nr:IKI3 family-domain-containing protein [Mycena floridula]